MKGSALENFFSKTGNFSSSNMKEQFNLENEINSLKLKTRTGGRKSSSFYSSQNAGK